MSRMYFQRTQQPGKGSALSGVSTALHPRTALVDIGNRVTEPKAQGAIRYPAAGGYGRRESRRGPVHSTPKANVASRRKWRKAPTKRVPQPTPELKLEPQLEQLETHFHIPVDVPACAVTADAMCQTCLYELLVVENEVPEDYVGPECTYLKEVYQYLRELEENQPIRPKYLDGKETNENMRAILIDWLVLIQMKFKLQQSTLYLSVTIIDCFLQDNAVSKKMLQLVGVTAMFIASKYEELSPLYAEDLAYITKDTYTTSEILQMESEILKALGFCLSRPTASEFLEMALYVAKVNTRERILAKYLLELCIVDYDMVHFPPSKTAAAASCLSLKILSGRNWPRTLQDHTSYTESDLLPVMQHIAKNVILANRGKRKAIKKKYDSFKYKHITSIEQLNSPIIWNLALSANKRL